MGERADVLIVGAGLSGLCAARKLRQEGVSVRIMEARDRVGGRIVSERIGEGVFDLGAQWIGPDQKRIRRLVDELGLKTVSTRTKGRKVLEVEGKVSTYKRSIGLMSIPNLIQLTGALSYTKRIRKQVSPSSPMSTEGAEGLDGETLETWRSRVVRSTKINSVMDAAVRAIFGAEAQDISALYFLMHINAGGGLPKLIEARGGAYQDSIVGGAQSLALALASDLGDAVSLDTPVRRLVQSRNGVDAVSDGRTIQGRYAIVAIPPVLSGRVEYAPSVSVGRDQLTQRFAMGASVKVIVTYDVPFWREAGFSGEVLSSDGPLSIVYDGSTADDRQPALVGLVAGSQARQWSSQPLPDRQRRVTGAFARYFGDAANAFSEYRELDWGMEAWSRGGPAAALSPGVLTHSFPHLRKPEGRLHWAGAETATESIGYMEGAIQAGQRAADEVLRRL